METEVKLALDTAEHAGQSIIDMVGRLRVLLDEEPVPVVPEPTEPPAPPAPSVPKVPVSIASVSTSRPDSASIKVDYELAGDMAAVTRLAVAIAPAGWQEFDTYTKPKGTVTVTGQAPGSGLIHFHIWDSTKAGWVIATNVPFASSGTVTMPGIPPVSSDEVLAPAVEAPSLVPVTGRFTFGTKEGALSLLDDGKFLIPIGVNVPGPNGYWGGGFTPIGKAARLHREWGWNFIRLFEQRPGGGDAPYTPSAHNPYTIAQVVEEYTAQGFIVMLDWHQYGFGAKYGAAQTNEMVQVHTGWANQFKNNPLVWFELANEPEATYYGYSDGAKSAADAQRMMADRWYNAFAPVIKAIRGTGATNMIVVCDSQAGQGCDDFWSMGESSGSAIMMRGADLVKADPLGQVMWDVHVYDAFGWAGPESMGDNCVGRYTDQQRDARLTSYVKRVWAATGRPVFAGEFGWQRGESATTGVGFHAPYKPKCGSRTLLAQQCLTRVALDLNMGGTQWPGFQLSSNGNDAYDAKSLLPCGADWMSYCMKAWAKMATKR